LLSQHIRIKEKPFRSIEQFGGKPITILNQNKPTLKYSMFDWPGPKKQENPNEADI
jgi:hypothetical protein